MIGFIFLGLGLLKILKRKRKKVELSKNDIEITKEGPNNGLHIA